MSGRTEQLDREQMLMEGMSWINGDDTGLSSAEMVCAVLRIAPKYASERRDHPRDPGDLGRCLRLVKKHPWAKKALPILAKRSPVWKRLEAAWDVLAAMMEDEVGIDWSKGNRAPNTYAAMQAVIAGGCKTDKG